MIKYISIITAIIVLILLLIPKFEEKDNITVIQYEMETQSFFCMDIFINLSAKGENASKVLEESKKCAVNIEKMISRNIETSEVYLLNNNKGEPMQVSDEMYELLKIAIEYAEETNGIYDPTIASITNLWGVNSQSPKVPGKIEIEKALQSVSYKNIQLLENNYVQLLNKANIELGAIAKGYVADEIYDIYNYYNVDSGIIALAGNIYLVGEKEENLPWTVGITDPDNPSKQNITIKLTNTSVVTAGAYERYFEIDGVIYHHIFDSKTGYPTDKDIKSVTIINSNSTFADVYSTTLFAMGMENAIDFLQIQKNIDAIIIDDDNNVYITENIKNSVILDSKYLTF